ncbi:unnamed protein product [Auanema sp. JU1783]|nr:unnamed protein product [Auanema sp. JU1783]
MGVNTPTTQSTPSVILYNPAQMLQYNSVMTFFAQQQYLQQQRQQELQGVLLNGMTPNMQSMQHQTARPFNMAVTPEMQRIAANQMVGQFDPAYQLPAVINPAFVSTMPTPTPKSDPTPTSLPNLQNMLLEHQLMAMRSNPSLLSFLPIEHIPTIPSSMAQVNMTSMAGFQALQSSVSSLESASMFAKHQQNLLEQKMKNDAAALKAQASLSMSSPKQEGTKCIVTSRVITIPRSEKVMKLMNYPATVEHLQKPRENTRPNVLRSVQSPPFLIDLSNDTPMTSPSIGAASTTTSIDSLTPGVFNTPQSYTDACSTSSLSDGNNNDVSGSEQLKKTQRKLKRKRNDMSNSKSSDSSPPMTKIGKEGPEVICDSQPTTSQTNSTVTKSDDSKKEEDPEVYVNVESDPVNGKLRRDQKRTIYGKVKHLLKRGNSLTCNLCKKEVLTNHNSVTDHLAGHSGEKQVACYFCGWTTFEKSLMGDHMKKYHPEKKEQKYEDIGDLTKMIDVFNECFPQPGRARHEYSEKLELFTQALMEKNIGRIDCGICEQKIQVNKKLIEKHVMSHPHFRCKSCPYLINNECEQQQHQNQEHQQSSPELGRDYAQCTSSDVMTKVFRKCFNQAFKHIEKTHPSSVLFDASPTISDATENNRTI